MVLFSFLKINCLTVFLLLSYFTSIESRTLPWRRDPSDVSHLKRSIRFFRKENMAI